jgi:hypothetical protein
MSETTGPSNKFGLTEGGGGSEHFTDGHKEKTEEGLTG